jgi:hypothetical protein
MCGGVDSRWMIDTYLTDMTIRANGQRGRQAWRLRAMLPNPMRPREFLDVLENPNLPRCDVEGEQAELLRTLLVHLFFADLDLDKRELRVLQRVLPDVNTREYVQSLASRRLDLDRLAELFPDSADRNDIVTLAEHALWSDDKGERREWSLVQRMIEKLGLVRR